MEAMEALLGPLLQADPRFVWGLFGRGLAAIQLMALADCRAQVLSFGGSRGVTPVRVYLRTIRRQLDCPALRWLYCPTLLWLADSDAALRAVPALGMGAAVLAITGLGSTGPCILAAGLCLLSLDCVFNLDKPWDHMLLELGWVGALLPQVLPLFTIAGEGGGGGGGGGGLVMSFAAAERPHPVVAWACRWLLWRVMFGFGKLKFVGTDHTRDQLYVRDFMIAQPIPTRLGWLAHVHLPLPVFKFLLLGMALAELPIPFLVFVPGLPRVCAALVLISLQIGIQLSGNFGWFNILTALCCLTLFDAQASLFDDHYTMNSTLQQPQQQGGEEEAPKSPSFVSSSSAAAIVSSVSSGLCIGLLFVLQLLGGLLHLPFASGLTPSWSYLPLFISWPSAPRRAFVALFRCLQPFHFIHGYGVFPPHTAPPLKLVPMVQGSSDGGTSWRTTSVT